VIDLSVAQVNLLGALTEWVVTCRENVAEIRKAMPFLPQPGSGPQCADHP
jgi:hypothetical protein